MVQKVHTDCPKCGYAMRLAFTLPKGELPKLQSFRCFACREVAILFEDEAGEFVPAKEANRQAA